MGTGSGLKIGTKFKHFCFCSKTAPKNGAIASQCLHSFCLQAGIFWQRHGEHQMRRIIEARLQDPRTPRMQLRCGTFAMLSDRGAFECRLIRKRFNPVVKYVVPNKGPPWKHRVTRRRGEHLGQKMVPVLGPFLDSECGLFRGQTRTPELLSVFGWLLKTCPTALQNLHRTAHNTAPARAAVAYLRQRTWPKKVSKPPTKVWDPTMTEQTVLSTKRFGSQCQKAHKCVGSRSRLALKPTKQFEF